MPNCYQSDRYGKDLHMPQDTLEFTGCTCHIAIANVPWQYYKNTYEPMRAFKTGTIFPELDKPFRGRRGCS